MEDAWVVSHTSTLIFMLEDLATGAISALYPNNGAVSKYHHIYLAIVLILSYGKERLQLIDRNARGRCFTVMHKNDMAISYLSEDKFLAYYEFDMWIAKHNGACVYECYGEKLGLP
jgi:hypothetical protein